MTVGPFDGRKKKFRCSSCTKSHLKCVGGYPCANCNRRGITCEVSVKYPKKAILVDRGMQMTQKTYGTTTTSPSPTVLKPSLTHKDYQFHCFDMFMKRNQFAVLVVSSTDVSQLLHVGDGGSYLMDAILALGAMQQMKLHPNGTSTSSSSQLRFSAFGHYSKAVGGLKVALCRPIDESQLRGKLLWTTLLLGLFELIIDPSGHGWLQHMIHGTSQALIASGALACRSGVCRRFFMQAKIFEVCRSIIFNEPTFLAHPEWTQLSNTLRMEEEDPSRCALDALLDIIVKCSSLRARVAKFIASLESPQHQIVEGCGDELSNTGFQLRQELNNWHDSFQLYTAGLGSDTHTDPAHTKDQDAGQHYIYLANVFFAAVSIYLSGIFDYEIVHWQSMGLPVPNLDEQQIQKHLSDILTLTAIVLDNTTISPLLLLFPLRIAGARSSEEWQQTLVIQLLERVERDFAVAGAFKGDLRALWARRAATYKLLQTSQDVDSK